jgi:hypothetical protein
MYDSGAWKPLALLIPLGVCILVERGLVPLMSSITGIPLWLLVILAVLFVIVFFRPVKPREYAHPHARMISVDTIEVTGDVHELQGGFHNYTSGATWTKTGDQHWRVEMPNLDQTDQTQVIIDAINEYGDGHHG